jgi:hypothetical protein
MAGKDKTNDRPRDAPPSRSSAAGSVVSQDAQASLLRQLESLNKDDQLKVLRTALERRLSDRKQVRRSERRAASRTPPSDPYPPLPAALFPAPAAAASARPCDDGAVVLPPAPSRPPLCARAMIAPTRASAPAAIAAVYPLSGLGHPPRPTPPQRPLRRSGRRPERGAGRPPSSHRAHACRRRCRRPARAAGPRAPTPPRRARRAQVQVLRDALRERGGTAQAAGPRFKGAWLSSVAPEQAVAKVLSARSSRGSWNK